VRDAWHAALPVASTYQADSLCCRALYFQAKGTESGAYEPMSDEDMEDAEMGEARVEARQRGKRGKGEASALLQGSRVRV
jgi:hypothetical protein